MKAKEELEQEEWPDVLGEAEAVPLEKSEVESILDWMGENIERKDEWLLELGDKLANLRVENTKLKAKVWFWREWAMVASGTVIVFLGWLIFLLWQGWTS